MGHGHTRSSVQVGRTPGFHCRGATVFQETDTLVTGDNSSTDGLQSSERMLNVLVVESTVLLEGNFPGLQ